eukprot:m.160771 g.160771  ORF g.160771 m.160771 type:complete len:61 (+) comp38783_c0_seq3:1607-1789(+)
MALSPKALPLVRAQERLGWIMLIVGAASGGLLIVVSLVWDLTTVIMVKMPELSVLANCYF